MFNAVHSIEVMLQGHTIEYTDYSTIHNGPHGSQPFRDLTGTIPENCEWENSWEGGGAFLPVFFFGGGETATKELAALWIVL